MNQEPAGERRISRRELYILAVIGMATMLLMGSVSELGARWRWAEHEINNCFDRKSGARFRPIANCETKIKNAEGPWTVMQYNECGYRSAHPCGPKPAGTRRVVLMGTSVAEGLYVQQHEHFSTRIETSLAERCGSPVEVQNVGGLAVAANRQYTLIEEVRKLKPDVVLLALAPFDLLSFNPPKFRPDTLSAKVSAQGNDAERVKAVGTPADEKAVRAPAPDRANEPAEDAPSLFARLRALARESRALIVAQHFLLENDDAFLRAYQLGNEDDALRVPVSAAYRDHYAGLTAHLKEMKRQLDMDSVQLYFAPLPNRIQATLLSGGVAIEGVDPLAYITEIKAIGERTGVGVVDAFPLFKATPHASRLFYAVDGHPTGAASKLMADAIESELLKSSRSFSTCTATR